MRKSKAERLPGWCSLRSVLGDYFYNMSYGVTKENIGFLLLFLLVYGINVEWLTAERRAAVYAVPALLTIVVSLFQRKGLSKQLYLAPVGDEVRERYINRLLFVKILVPVSLTIVFDLLLLYAGGEPLMMAVQMIPVVSISAITGMLFCSSPYESSGNAAYGFFQGLVRFVLAFVYVVTILVEVVMSAVADGTQGSRMICVVMLILAAGLYAIALVPLAIYFPTLRKNFANYEKVSNHDTKDALYEYHR